ncbi:hypothetical protein DNTS_033304 [Danionella cerebrum]|uniref:Uncharacterized protein n=1 Tax=Danionella cerebrum TaxID=2873325 RepID=A0A553PMZ6_9TELE|nr:hypothetical protein DNTS_033304 [Danionella translucida]
MELIRRKDWASDALLSDDSENDCEDVGAHGGESTVCLCENAIFCDPHTHEDSRVKCVRCGKTRVMITRFSEGYGTEEECFQTHPLGDSDADADIEDTDSRLQIVGSLQRISSRKRKRQRITRQDTTESEDDSGLSQRTHRWSLRLSPHRTHNRTILEESVSQVRPLVICRCTAGENQNPPDDKPMKENRDWLKKVFTIPPALPLSCYLFFIPLSLTVILLLMTALLPFTEPKPRS